MVSVPASQFEYGEAGVAGVGRRRRQRRLAAAAAGGGGRAGRVCTAPAAVLMHVGEPCTAPAGPRARAGAAQAQAAQAQPADRLQACCNRTWNCVTLVAVSTAAAAGQWACKRRWAERGCGWASWASWQRRAAMLNCVDRTGNAPAGGVTAAQAAPLAACRCRAEGWVRRGGGVQGRRRLTIHDPCTLPSPPGGPDSSPAANGARSGRGGAST